MRYNPQAWFWLADDGRVFDSSRALIVDKTDTTYAAWVAAGGTASRWPVDTTGAQTAAALQWVFDNADLTIFVDPASYANHKQWSLATGGYTLTLSGQTLTFATDTASRSEIMGMFLRLAQPNPPATVNWQFATGFVAVAAADFVKAASAVADFVQATFAALQVVLAAIAAGTITTVAQVDAATWPSAVAASS